jgi:large subunit ribosomal protein L6
MPIDLPQGVKAEIDSQTNSVKVSGPRGTLERAFNREMTIELHGAQLAVTRPSDARQHKALHGLTRALLANMVHGVSQGFVRKMQVIGVGYRADLRGEALVLNVGYSHPVEIPAPPGIKFSVEKGGRDFAVEGIDRELVGQVAAKIRAVRRPEPYKGKGVMYADEKVRIKAGKAGKAAK